MVVECFKSDHQDYEKLKDIICKMHSGEANNITEDDDLILDFGTVVLEKTGEKRWHSLSSKMKQLACLVLKVRELEGDQVSLMGCIHPQMFDAVTEASKALSVHEMKKKLKMEFNMMQHQAYGLHLGPLLTECCMMKIGQGIR